MKMQFGFSQITSRLYLGGKLESPADIADLQRIGITRIINCSESPDPYGSTIFQSCWPQPAKPDDGTPRGADWFRQGRDFWLPTAMDVSQKTYLHCDFGINRSATMLYFFLRLLGLGPIDARLVIVSNRPMDAIGIRYSAEADALIA